MKQTWIRVLPILTLVLLAVPASAQDMVDISDAAIECDSPRDVANWPIVTTITTLDVNRNGVLATFDKRDGVNRWPESTPPGWDGGIQYTLWIGLQQAGRWHLGGIIEFWYSRGYDGDDAGGDVTQNNQVKANWTYYCGGGMNRQPAAGEQVAWFVTQGSARRKDVSARHERSNVVLAPFPAAAPASFRFEGTPTTPPIDTGHEQTDDERIGTILERLGELQRAMVALQASLDAQAAGLSRGLNEALQQLLDALKAKP